ncbi:unnamed protein product, partial [Symbiodinium microadriaticum]
VTQCISMEAGDALIFPAKRLMHRVTVVKSGVRKTLVMWAWDKQSSRYHTAPVRASCDPAVCTHITGA